MFTIKDFGNNTEVKTINELKQTLETKYNNTHVTVELKRENKINKLFFVSIKYGEVFNSYGKKEKFNFFGLRGACELC